MLNFIGLLSIFLPRFLWPAQVFSKLLRSEFSTTLEYVQTCSQGPPWALQRRWTRGMLSYSSQRLDSAGCDFPSNITEAFTGRCPVRGGWGIPIPGNTSAGTTDRIHNLQRSVQGNMLIEFSFEARSTQVLKMKHTF